MLKRKMPIGIQTFDDIRRDGNVYVDKTRYVYKLVKDSKFYFLGRPRRFGKSLLVSTLKAYFLGKKELFKGLAIETLEQDWETYPVFHLDLSLGNFNNVEGLASGLDINLRELEHDWGSDPDEKTSSARLRGLIRRAADKSGKQVVILIDEYDKPLLQTLENGKTNEEIRSVLKSFFGVLKSADQYIRFAFLTGVTRFSQVSLFSDLNQLRDISMEKDYAGVCGITESELIPNFEPELQALAKETGKTYEDILAEMRKKFDGYHFSHDSEGIYNPFSLLNTFAKLEIGYYWFASGTPTFLITEMKNTGFLPTDFSNKIIATEKSIADYRPGSGNPESLFYQSGYLTITDYNPKNSIYTLGFPNDEVKYGFLEELLPYYTNVRQGQCFYIGLFLNDLDAGNIEGFMTRLRAFFADIPYELNDQSERHYQVIFYLVFKLLGQYSQAEYRSAKGRADAVVKTDDAVYVFEFKLDGSISGEAIAGQVELALRQIDDKSYLIPFSAEGRKLVKIGVVFDAKERNIGDWKAVPAPANC